MRRSQAGSTLAGQPRESLRPRMRDEESAAVAASVVVFSNRGLAALRTTLHSVWSEATEAQLIVVTGSRDAEVADYLLRQYRRGRIAGLGVASVERQGSHCDLDRVGHLAVGSAGGFVARVSDELALQAGWLDKALAVMECVPAIGCLGLLGSDRHTPGPRHKLGLGAVLADEVDTTCFVTRSDLLELHCTRLPRNSASDSCGYQVALRRLGFHIGHLAGLAKRADSGADRTAPNRARIVGDMAFHGSQTVPARRTLQAYELGQDVLINCVCCGNGELEVLTAEVEFCAQHDVAIGHTYTMRCPRCGKLQFEEDLQLACPPA